jgi:hypothetical protein
MCALSSIFTFIYSFVTWVETLFDYIQTCVINNGWISEIFKNTRGNRQRCPLSALLFVISVEIMALRLRENKNMNGIKVKIDDKAHIIKISQLADDTTLCASSKTDIASAMNVQFLLSISLVNFGRMSVFIIRMFPIIVRFLFPHVVN